MTYDEQTALRLVRAVVDDGTSQFVPPLRRDVLRRLVAAIDMLKRENATLRQCKAEQKGSVPYGD